MAMLMPLSALQGACDWLLLVVAVRGRLAPHTYICCAAPSSRAMLPRNACSSYTVWSDRVQYALHAYCTTLLTPRPPVMTQARHTLEALLLGLKLGCAAPSYLI